MDENEQVNPAHEPKNRVLRFLARYRRKRDQEMIDVLGSPSGAKDVHDAQLAQQTSSGKNSAEAGRGITYL